MKIHKNCEKKWPKITRFLVLLTIIATIQKHLEACNLAILVDKAFCQLCVVTRNSLVQYMRYSSPNNEATSNGVVFSVFGSAVTYPPKSGYPSAEAP